MRRLIAWLWKEWRDHRALLIGIAAAIPVLVTAAFLAFMQRLGQDMLSLDVASRVLRAADVTGFFYLGAVALVVLAGASDLFGGEVQRGTLDLVRRTPRGMPLVFGAKVVFLAAMHVAAVLWTALVVALAWTVTGSADGFTAAWQALGNATTGQVLAAGFALSLWIALASSWIPRGAAAVGAALLLLALLLLPGTLALRDHPYVAKALVPDIPKALAALAAVALVASGASFLWGLRLRRGTWSAAWRGLAVVLVVFTGGYAYGANRLARFLDFAPGEEGVGLFDACLGEGGRHLYFNAARGLRSRGETWLKFSTPPRAFVLDLETGDVRRLREDAATYVSRVEGARGGLLNGYHRLEPAPVVICSTYVGDEVTAEAWMDARTATLRKVYPPRFRGPDTAEWLREGLRAATRVRDAEGRRAWIRPVLDRGTGVVEREGEPAPDRPSRDQAGAHPAAFPVIGGWKVYVTSGGLTEATFLDASSGAVRPGPKVDNAVFLLSPDRYLRREMLRERNHEVGTWLVGYVAAGSEHPAVNPPNTIGYVAVRDRVLASRDGETLVLWDPVTGTDEPVAWEGFPTNGFTAISCLGQRADRDLHLVQVTPADSRASLAILDPASRTIRVVVRQAHVVRELIAITDDGALLAIDRDEQRVVRYRPGRGEDVLLPR